MDEKTGNNQLNKNDLNRLETRSKTLNALKKLKTIPFDEMSEKITLLGGVKIIKKRLKLDLRVENSTLRADAELLLQATLDFIAKGINPLLGKTISLELANSIDQACKRYIEKTQNLNNAEYKALATDLHRKTVSIFNAELENEKNEKITLLGSHVERLNKNYSELTAKNKNLKELIDSTKLNWSKNQTVTIGEEFEQEIYQTLINTIEKNKDEIRSVQNKYDNLRTSESINSKEFEKLSELIKNYQKNVEALKKEVEVETKSLMKTDIQVTLSAGENQLNELESWLDDAEKDIASIKEIGSLDEKIVKALETRLATYRALNNARIDQYKAYTTQFQNSTPEEIENLHSAIKINLGSIESFSKEILTFNNTVTKHLLSARENKPAFEEKIRKEKEIKKKTEKLEKSIQVNLEIFKENIEISAVKCHKMNNLEATLCNKNPFTDEFNTYSSTRGKLATLTKEMEALLKEKPIHPSPLEDLEKRNIKILRMNNEVKKLANSPDISIPHIQNCCDKKIDAIQIKITELEKNKEILEGWVNDTSLQMEKNRQLLDDLKKETSELRDALENQIPDTITIINEATDTKDRSFVENTENIFDSLANGIRIWIEKLLMIFREYGIEKVESPKDTFSKLFPVEQDPNTALKNLLKGNNYLNDINSVLKALENYISASDSPTAKNTANHLMVNLKNLKKTSEDKSVLEDKQKYHQEELKMIEPELKKQNELRLKLQSTKETIQSIIDLKPQQTSTLRLENPSSQLEENQTKNETVEEKITSFVKFGISFFSPVYEGKKENNKPDPPKENNKPKPPSDTDLKPHL